MSSHNERASAYPSTTLTQITGDHDDVVRYSGDAGLTKLEYFTAAAMTGISASVAYEDMNLADIAMDAVRLAKFTLAQLAALEAEQP